MEQSRKGEARSTMRAMMMTLLADNNLTTYDANGCDTSPCETDMTSLLAGLLTQRNVYDVIIFDPDGYSRCRHVRLACSL